LFAGIDAAPPADIQRPGAEFRPARDYSANQEIPRKSVNSVADSPVQHPDSPLIAAAARGDNDARRQLFERYRDVAYRVAFRITRRDADALDVVQDAFIRAFDKLADFTGTASFKTWLLRIVSNRALDLLRARKVRIAAPLDGGSDEAAAPQLATPEEQTRPDRHLEASEQTARIRAAIEELPPAQRAVFALYATGDFTYGEIAETLDIAIGTVMSRLFHARKRLQAALRDEGLPAGSHNEPPDNEAPTD
jgi:RNA polymerase sigma-70 factor (ECF subfamily)